MLTHHAYLIEDSTSLFDAYVNGIRTQEKFDADSPDFFAQKYESFGIDEARELIARASLKKLGERALFFICISSIGAEAQQALLKLFEEPQIGLVFVVLTPPGIFIPTLRSRFIPYAPEVSAKQTTGDAKKFLAASYKDRSAIAAELIEDDDEDSKEKVRDFLSAIESILAPHISKSAEVRTSLEDITKFRSYVNDRSPSLKMILEHFAATLPHVK
ncbi:MAG TPA: hypothetical protein VG984_03135 [Candidatus Paceibacterota bacterium]|nr:hypothetical protein [Candidatus Paceibacterota bacterium]